MSSWFKLFAHFYPKKVLEKYGKYRMFQYFHLFTIQSKKESQSPLLAALKVNSGQKEYKHCRVFYNAKHNIPYLSITRFYVSTW